MLDDGLKNLARRIKEDLGIDVKDLPGAGAAGGLGAGLHTFFGAQLSLAKSIKYAKDNVTRVTEQAIRAFLAGHTL